MEIHVPDGLVGEVTIQCTSIGEPTRPVEVGPSGQAEATCPMKPPEIRVTRSNDRLVQTSLPKWGRTGDGFPVTCNLSVR
jgi:hypothetical protein